MSWLNREIELPEVWDDVRIQSSAGLLGLVATTEVNQLLVEKARNYLETVADEHGLDPDQIHRAIAEHEPFLMFQESDDKLLKGAFPKILLPWSYPSVED